MQTPDTTNKDWSSTLAELITRIETSADRVLLASLSQKLNTPDLLDKQQAAEFLTIAVRTLDDWRKAKIIPTIRRGGFIRFRKQDLEAFLDSHTTDARKAAPFRPRRKRTPHSAEQGTAA